MVDVGFESATTSVLYDTAEGAVQEYCCVEYGTNCACCASGTTPKYLTAIISGILSAEGLCSCNGCTNYPTGGSVKRSSILIPNGVYVLTQVAGTPCRWRYYDSGILGFHIDGYFTPYCTTEISSADMNGLDINVYRQCPGTPAVHSLYCTVAVGNATADDGIIYVADIVNCASGIIPLTLPLINQSFDCVFPAEDCDNLNAIYSGQVDVREGLC